MKKFDGFDENGYLPFEVYEMDINEIEEIFW